METKQRVLIIDGGNRAGVASMVRALGDLKVFEQLPPRSQRFLRELGETPDSYNRGQERDRAAKRKREHRIERNLRNEARQGREPEGLQWTGNHWLATCKSCKNDYEFPCDAAEFDPDMSYCGSSQWCCP
jgi:hypothetical protein